MSTPLHRRAAFVAVLLLAASLPTAFPAAHADGLPAYIPPNQVLRNVQVAGTHDIPGNATAVFANVTLTDSGGAGYLTLSDNFQTPTSSTVNVSGRGQTASNLALLRLNAAGQFDIYASAGADVVVDVQAYLVGDADIRPVQSRILDSRNDPSGRLPAGTKRIIQLGEQVRPDATVAVVNLTVTNSASAGYTAAVPCSLAGPPATSNNNVDAINSTRGVLAFAPIENGAICVVSQNPSDLVVDLEGDIAGTAVDVIAGGPQRFLDSRNSGAFAAAEARPVSVLGEADVPNYVGVLGTLTSVDTPLSGWAALAPTASNGAFSNLNYASPTPVPNAFLSGMTDGHVVVQTLQRGQFIVDAMGYLKPGSYQLLAAPARVLDTRLGNPPKPLNSLGSCIPGAPIAGVSLPSGVKALAFTFDDGPDAVNTEKIMNAFRDRGLEGQAFFFWIGERIGPLANVAREVVARGYGVGNHSWSHQYSGTVDVREIPWTNAAIAEYTGQQPTFFRSPGLTRSSLNDQAMRNYGMCNLFTQSDLSDWTAPRVPADLLVQHAKSRIRNGDFVLMHDGGSHLQTALAIGRILDWAIAAGYQIVTPSQLLQMGTPIYYIGGGPQG